MPFSADELYILKIAVALLKITDPYKKDDRGYNRIDAWLFKYMLEKDVKGFSIHNLEWVRRKLLNYRRQIEPIHRDLYFLSAMFLENAPFEGEPCVFSDLQVYAYECAVFKSAPSIDCLVTDRSADNLIAEAFVIPSSLRVGETMAMAKDAKDSLPKGWQWSYVLPSLKEHDGKMVKPSACAVRFLGKRNFADETGLYNEVFARGDTEEEAMAKVIDYIKNHRRFKRRWIHFSGD